MDKQATWLDVMPAIPLALGVPVIAPEHRLGAVVVLTTGGVWLANRGEGPAGQLSGERLDRWRVDLADPQGFGYALRHYQTQHGGAIRWVARWMNDETTDGDRLALAEALAELAKAAA